MTREVMRYKEEPLTIQHRYDLKAYQSGSQGGRTSRPLIQPRLGLTRPSSMSRGTASRHSRLPDAATALICATTLSTTACLAQTCTVEAAPVV